MEKTPLYNQMLWGLRLIAEQNQTPFDAQDIPEYEWTSFTFQTDKFGGDYMNICLWYDGTMRDNFKKQPITLQEVRTQVPKLKAEMLKNRDLSKVDEFINEQYY